MDLRARLWPGLRPRSIWLDAVIAVVGTVVVGVSGATPDAPPLPLVVIGDALLFVLLLCFRRRAPLAPFVVAAALAGVSPALTAAVPIAAYAVGRYTARWPMRIVGAVIGTVAVLQPWLFAPFDQFFSRIATVAVFVILFGAIGVYVRTRAELLVALRERAERAESERELMAREAVLDERTRIAREMHDAVGHRVSLMVLQAGAIEMAAADRRRVEELAGQVQEAGRQALDELRQMVGVLRAGEGDDAPLSPQPELDALPGLVDASRAAGMTVDLGELPDGPVDAAVGRAAYRIVQEALTNAGKHAPAAPVCVEVDRRPGELVVRIVNGPAAEAANPASGGGFGLVGLGERVRTLGGRLSAEPRLDGGFAVEAVLPA